MEFRHLGSLSALFCLALLGSHVQASPPAEDYWRSLWPNTPMPKALTDLTHPESEWNNWSWRARGGTQPELGDSKAKYKIHYGEPLNKGDSKIKYKISYGEPLNKGSVPAELETQPKLGDSQVKYKVHYGESLSKGDNQVKYKVHYGEPLNKGDNQVKYKVHYGEPLNKGDSQVKYKVHYGEPLNKGSVPAELETQPKLGDSQVKYKVHYGEPLNKGDSKIKYKIHYGEPFNKGSVPTELETQPKLGDSKIKYKIHYGKPLSKGSIPTEVEDTLNAIFFFERDLHTGKKLNVEFTKRSDDTFLPDRVAKSIPFSTTKFPEILNHFSIEAGSAEAETMRSTLETCEEPAMKGEDKYCATSLESLVNFSVSKLGKNIRLLSTVLEKETPKQQQYSVMEGVQKDGETAVVCHKLDYPYTVFYCHKIASRAYTVPLVGADGKKVKALAVCHTDTKQWSPEHIAFQQLHVKPGTVPICHFLSTDTLLWVPN